MNLRVMIVDDEPSARDRLRMLLREHEDVTVLGECGDGLSALRAIRERSPDLVFLDVQMPGLDGFGVLDAMTGERMPGVIFMSSADAYALQKLEAHALDHLLKPFDRERFQRTLERARAEIARSAPVSRELTAVPGRAPGPPDRRFTALLRSLRADGRVPDHIVIRDGGKIASLPPQSIDWVEAAGNYVSIQCGRSSHLLRETMKGMEARLDGERFLRIHRSLIVNLERVERLASTPHGEYVVTLAGGKSFQSGRGYAPRLRERMRQRRAPEPVAAQMQTT
jgi:two-component system, LytTR family, response regulator